MLKKKKKTLSQKLSLCTFTQPTMDPSEISLSLFISFYVTSCCPLELIGLDQEPKQRHKYPPNNILSKV